jgi:type II secretory pathway predicted ATPase ExeA
VHHDAVDFLSKLEGKIGIIAVCGKYRTGKSYLLNKLFMETLNNEKNRNSSSSEISIRKDRISEI